MLALETPRLRLREFHYDDTLALETVLGDAEVMKHGPGSQSKEQIQKWLAETLQLYELHKFGPLAIIEKGTGAFVGYCGLFFFCDLDGQEEIEIGYRLARNFWRNGYATESATAVRDFAFNQLGLHRLVAMIDPFNTASVRVAAKLGMKHEKDIMFDGYTHPDHLYVIINPTQTAIADIKE